jgi:hypothetical protein
MYQRHGSTEYDLEHYLEILNEADACQSYIAEYDSESVFRITKLRNYNAECDADSASAFPTLQMRQQQSTSESTPYQA